MDKTDQREDKKEPRESFSEWLDKLRVRSELVRKSKGGGRCVIEGKYGDRMVVDVPPYSPCIIAKLEKSSEHGE